MTETKEIDWEKIVEEYISEDNPNDFVMQVFSFTTTLLKQQMDEKSIDEISVEMGDCELILKRAKPITKRPVYEH